MGEVHLYGVKKQVDFLNLKFYVNIAVVSIHKKFMPIHALLQMENMYYLQVIKMDMGIFILCKFQTIWANYQIFNR